MWRFLVWLKPEDKYREIPRCKNHIRHIVILYVVMACLIIGTTAAAMYLWKMEIRHTTRVFREKPTALPIQVKSLTSFEDTRWVFDHGLRLIQEGSGKDEVVVVEHTMALNTPEFDWILTTAPGFTISNRASYKVVSHGERLSLEPLTLMMPSTDTIEIKVSESNQGDKILAIVRVSGGESSKNSGDLLKILHSRPR